VFNLTDSKQTGDVSISNEEEAELAARLAQTIQVGRLVILNCID